MKKLPQIFLTNDDGIHSPGLRAAVKAVMHLGEVTVVAPLTQQTGMGRSFSGNMDAPLKPVEYTIDGQHINAFSCEGSPALAVQHGLVVLFPQNKPDLLISGINYGENLGSNITISGTVGAALEGACQGIPSLAVSLQTEQGAYFHYSDRDWDTAMHFLTMFARSVLTQSLPFDVDVLKIDVPGNATTRTPWRLTRLSRNRYYVASLENPTLESRPRDLTLNIHVKSAQREPESDVYALIINQVVSVTPLSLDCTSRTDFQTIYDHLSP
jgi:5'-nucleotidase